jgi:antitoxin component YwqK of YwqJK toxin-antitoxin module
MKRIFANFQLTALAILLLLAACNNNNEFERVMSTWPDGSNQIVFVMKGNEKKAVKIAERRYYENGQLQYEKHFSGKDSHLDGKALYYYPTGELFASGDYSHNHTKGNDWSILDRQGNPYLQGDFDSIIINDFSEYGTPATVIFYQANTQFTYQFYSNCALRSSGKTVDGKREGPWLFYHPNGLLQTEAAFTAGRENGKYTVYRDNGIPYYCGLYENGKRTGEWEFYDDEGNIAQRQKF